MGRLCACEAKIGQLKWAIDQRGKIQHSLLALYERVQEREDLPADFELDLPLDHLIAAAFSLWRAVFLADKDRGPIPLRQAQLAFLATVVTTNAVNFSDDRNNSPWSVTFYMENAKQRLVAANEFLRHYPKSLKGAEVDFANVIRLVRIKGPTPADMRYEWTAAHLAFRKLYNGMFATTPLKEEEPTIPFDQ